MTNWVTIKIPAETRDQARKLEPTYEDIMQAGIHALTDDNEDKHPVTRGELEDVMNEISMANSPGVEIDTKAILDRLGELERDLPEKTRKEIEENLR